MRTYQIVLAEDDENDCFLLKRAFAKAGIEANILLAEDGLRAIEHLKMLLSAPGGLGLDLILLDLKMPRLDGFGVLSWVRSQPGLAGVSVVILSSSDRAADMDRAAQLGADHYLVKPGAPAELVGIAQRLTEYIQQKQTDPCDADQWSPIPVPN